MWENWRRVALNLIMKIHQLQANRNTHRLLSLKIQIELIRRIRRAELRVRALRNRTDAIKARLSERDHDRETARAFRKGLETIHNLINEQRSRIEFLKSVGDAIAFIYADRFDLKPLAFKQAPGFASGKKGVRLERSILRAVFGSGGIALLNDLTHTLRYGDVTAFRENGTFAIIEAKTGRGGSFARQQRQKTALEAMSSYLSTDERQDGLMFWRRVTNPIKTSDYGNIITQMASSLQPGDWLQREVEPGLLYFVIDGRGAIALWSKFSR